MHRSEFLYGCSAACSRRLSVNKTISLTLKMDDVYVQGIRVMVIGFAILWLFIVVVKRLRQRLEQRTPPPSPSNEKAPSIVRKATDRPPGGMLSSLSLSSLLL